MPDAAPAAAAPAAAITPPAAAGGAPADAVAKGAAEAPKTDPAKHKVKVDGKEAEVTLEELIRGYQTDQAGQKKLKEASDKEKALGVERENLGKAIKAAKAGDYKALVELGLTEEEIDTLSVKVLSERQHAALEKERRDALDPEKRELEDLRRERDARKKQDEEREQGDKQKQIADAEDQITDHVVNTLKALPPEMRDDYFASRVLEVWEYAIEHAEEIEKRGIKVTPQYIAEKVKAEGLALAKRLAAKDTAAAGGTPAAQHPALGAVPIVRTEAKPGEQKRKVGDAEATRGAYRFTGRRVR